MRSHMLVPLALAVLLGLCSAQTNICAQFNRAPAPIQYGSGSTYEHLSGSHNWVALMGANCTYSGTNPQQACTITANASASALVGESGALSNLVEIHEVNKQTAQGAGFSNGPALSVDSEAAAAARDCPPWGCGVSIGITGSGLGGGFSVSFPSDAIFADKQHYAVRCAGPVYGSGTGGCVGGVETKCGGGGGSPIVIAMKHRADVTKLFSNPKEACVRFNLHNDNKPPCLSWPKRDSRVAFLVYDRDHDGGIVDSGAELFGTFTPHADGDYLGAKGKADVSGFTALAWFDQPQQGGNLDLEITPKDKVWPQLKLWFPDHCWDHPDEACASIPSELHSLDSEGIHSLSLVVSPSWDVDPWGNQFKFYAQVNPKPHELQQPDDELNERRMWDVWLAVRK
ncbi:MAG TPA: hypothetical protein VMQ17_08965 [Candidatus Sulfotelmatobacter sp.]|nr:hypothetical protein [Candidatus Sulfotelmatobacter sp.]